MNDFFSCACSRVGHHSTSDDSSAYRSIDEVTYWDREDHPISRFAHYLKRKGLWDEKMEEELRRECKKRVMEAFAGAEKSLKPSLETMFTDVYEEMPKHLEKQFKELKDHIAKYPDHYPKNVST